jgi:hypothetical protein
MLNSTCEWYYFDTNLTAYTYFFGVFMKMDTDMTYCQTVQFSLLYYYE